MPHLTEKKSHTQRTVQVVNHIQKLIADGLLQPGDQVPPEREFARMLKISRASLRTGMGYLAAMGVLKVRHGVGTFVADGPPELGKSSLNVMGALYGFQPWQMFEARVVLESQLAALAAERGTASDHGALAEEIAEMYATIDSPTDYLIHDLRFHRTIARASGNPILASLMETVTSALYDVARKAVGRPRDRRESAELHHEIYKAIRSRKAADARRLMEQHLRMAEAQWAENNATQSRDAKNTRAGVEKALARQKS
jgi:GntR family transcriptional regulator, transcriptional repressor for pyruvate dehydrogenase complex